MILQSPIAAPQQFEYAEPEGDTVGGLGSEKEGYIVNEVDPDVEFGGCEERKQKEKDLVWKLDLRYVRALSRVC